MTSALDRRSFLRRSAVAAGSGVLSATALDRLALHEAMAGTDRDVRSRGTQDGYGPLKRKPDQRGEEVLALPKGFSYVTFGAIGSMMSDGNRTPLALDGMAAFPGPERTVRLIRNHEDRNAPGAGSVGPENANPASRFERRHGYAFEVPRGRKRTKLTAPIIPMGRFSHEALATDQRTGIVYQTEDAGSGRGSGFYRYIPRDPSALHAGGRLEMLAVEGKPQYDARESQRVDRSLRAEWVRVPDPDPDYQNDDDPSSVFNQGFERGGAKFNRLEGCWYDEGSVFFVSTSGGDAKNGDVNPDGFQEGYGQVWEYRTRGRSEGELTLIYESPGGEALDSPDNLTVTPRAGLILCEDDASSADGDTHPLAPEITNVNRLIGVDRKGRAFEFAVNVLSESELAGACFSPDGDTLFVNIFGDSSGTIEEHAGTGMTCAITGPWRDGPL